LPFGDDSWLHLTVLIGQIKKERRILWIR
jgi:hypothetical protein